VIASIDLCRAVLGCQSIELWIDGERCLSANNPEIDTGETEAGLEFVRQAASDLKIFQDHAHTHFGMPALSIAEVLQLRFVSLMIDGKCPAYPGRQLLNAEVAREHIAAAQPYLDGEPVTGWNLSGEYVVELGRRQISIGPVMIIMPGIHCSNAEQVKAHIADEGVGMIPLNFEAAEGRSAVAYMPDQIDDPSKALTPVPWGIPGFPEQLDAETAKMEILPAQCNRSS